MTAQDFLCKALFLSVNIPLLAEEGWPRHQ